ncbi:MAG: addiction module toxin, RelE/StbE family [Burkholderiales bacterium]|jgi:mRNA interferase RelE/StbE|nr:addiction module toxin, RelE/StbE family [Burkholderiales bacterium]
MWSVRVGKTAEKELKKLDKQTQIRISKELIKISINPRGYGKGLTGKLSGLWRYRVGDYRIVCELIDKIMVVMVVSVAHRQEIYKNL